MLHVSFTQQCLIMTHWTSSAEHIECLAFSPTEPRFVAGCKDGLICTWDASEPTGSFNILQRRSGTLASVSSVTYSHNGKLIASGSKNGTANVFETQSSESIELVSPDDSIPITCIAFSSCASVLWCS